MRRNNGFSLIELIIVLAIVAIAGIGVFGFMTFGTRAFSKSNKDVKLQYEQQVTVNQIRDLILETAYGISYDEAASPEILYIFAANDAPKPTNPSEPYAEMKINRLRFEESSGKIYLGSTTAFASSGLSGVESGFASVSEVVLADNIGAFSIDTDNIKKLKMGLSITFELQDKSVQSDTVIALRNNIFNIDDSTDLEKLYTKKVEILNSFIDTIAISRKENGIVMESFGQGGTDTIIHAGRTVSAQYDAMVTAKANTMQNYFAVSWSLEEVNGDGLKGITVSPSGKVTIASNATANKFKLVATSMDDNTKSTYIFVTIAKEGKWAKKAELFLEKNGNPNPVKGNGLLIYSVNARVTYDVYRNGKSGIEEVSEGLNLVRVSLINGGDIPEGAGWDEKYGTFTATKSMEGKTYNFRVEANDRGIDGDGNAVIIYDESFSISVDEVPKATAGPVITVGELGERGAYHGASLSWATTDGDGNSSTPAFLYYDIEWSLEKAYDDNGNTAWSYNSNDKYRSFDKVYFKGGEKKYTRNNNYLTANVFCDVNLDWSRDYKYYVKAVCREKKSNNGEYTGQEMTAVKLVTIPKVEVVLQLTDKRVINYNDRAVTDVIDTDYTIGLGKRYNPGIVFGENSTPQTLVKDYYKIFMPVLEDGSVGIKGLSVTSSNINTVFGIWASDKGTYGWNKDHTSIKNGYIRPYYISGSRRYYEGDREKLVNGSGGVHTIYGVDNYFRFFVGAVLTPSEWIGNYLNPQLMGVEYGLVLSGTDMENGKPVNSVACKFINSDGSVKNYVDFKVVNDYTK